MVRKYTLSVADEDAARIDQWKEKFNLSDVFRTAMLREIDKLEAFQMRAGQKEDSSMEEVIKRLRREKAETLDALATQGREDGQDWAKSVHYADLVAAVAFELPTQGGGFVAEFADSSADECSIPYVLHELYEEHPELDPGDGGYLTEGAVDYMAAFLDGVKDVWEVVSKEL